MKNAWIEVKTESNTCQIVAKELRGFHSVKEADALFGNIDVLVLVEIDDEQYDYLDQLEKIITKIKGIEGVVTTVTRPVKRPKG